MVVIAVETRWKLPLKQALQADTLHGMALALRAMAVDLEKLAEKVPDEVNLSIAGYGDDQHILVVGETLEDK